MKVVENDIIVEMFTFLHYMYKNYQHLKYHNCELVIIIYVNV